MIIIKICVPSLFLALSGSHQKNPKKIIKIKFSANHDDHENLRSLPFYWSYNPMKILFF
jgi:hypothetical protein